MAAIQTKLRYVNESHLYYWVPKPSGASFQYFHSQTNKYSIRELPFITTPLIIAVAAPLNWLNMQGMHLRAQLLASSRTDSPTKTNIKSSHTV